MQKKSTMDFNFFKQTGFQEEKMEGLDSQIFDGSGFRTHK